jgi:hypothetical protein
MKIYPAIPAECEECPLPDCYQDDPRCPVKQLKAYSQGATLPEIPLDAPVGKRGPKRKHSDIAPAQFADVTDYHRRYSRAYNVKFRRVSIRGIKLFKGDVDILRSLCEADGRTLEEEIVTLLEGMAAKARLKQGGDALSSGSST